MTLAAKTETSVTLASSRVTVNAPRIATHADEQRRRRRDQAAEDEDQQHQQDRQREHLGPDDVALDLRRWRRRGTAMSAADLGVARRRRRPAVGRSAVEVGELGVLVPVAQLDRQVGGVPVGGDEARARRSCSTTTTLAHLGPRRDSSASDGARPGPRNAGLVDGGGWPRSRATMMSSSWRPSSSVIARVGPAGLRWPGRRSRRRSASPKTPVPQTPPITTSAAVAAEHPPAQPAPRRAPTTRTSSSPRSPRTPYACIHAHS